MRIALPSNVAWIDLEYNLIGLRSYQRPWLPQIPQPQTVHLPAVDPKKATAAKGTRTSARCAAAQAKASGSTEEVATEKNKNGKRARDAETDGAEGVAPKRVKRTAGAKGKKAAGEAQTGARTKRSRATRASTAQAVVDAAQGTPSTAAPSKKTRSKARATKKTGKASISSPVIRIVPPPKDNAEMDVDVQVTDEPPATTSDAPAAAPKVLLKAYCTPPNAIETIPSSSPLSDPPSTPGSNIPADSPSPGRTGTRRAHRRVASRAESDVSELSTTLSATTTLVPTPDVSDGELTRAGTPGDLEDKAAPGEGKADTTQPPPASACTPVRVSARIRAKKESISPGSSDDFPRRVEARS
ncbi:hypothetical protein GY45DRAFT_1328738 [Cubamyces sp. BRFM 1775]|nr:hypothetical protein GY45DRAFT_1328738 [Cubamyces sp. BRFM 1775]